MRKWIVNDSCWQSQASGKDLLRTSSLPSYLFGCGHSACNHAMTAWLVACRACADIVHAPLCWCRLWRWANQRLADTISTVCACSSACVWLLYKHDKSKYIVQGWTCTRLNWYAVRATDTKSHILIEGLHHEFWPPPFASDPNLSTGGGIACPSNLASPLLMLYVLDGCTDSTK